MNRIIDTGENHQSWKNLPPLVGIASMKDAITKGFSVEETVRRLKRYHYALRRLYEIFNDHITAEPVYELKMAFSLHSHLCAEHVTALRKRVSEMREPPLGLDKIPDEDLRLVFDEILASSSTEERVTAIYGIVLPDLVAGMKRHLDETNPLTDHPSTRVLRFALLELGDMAAWGSTAIRCLCEDKAVDDDWLALIENLLARAGSIDGTQDVSDEIATAELVPMRSATPYKYDGVVKRDERFSDPYNMGVNAEIFLYNEDFDDAAKVIMMFYKRLREIDVPEMMASIIAETPDKPWDYYRDMTRQLWDEARHAMMGEIGLTSLGLDWTKIPVNHTWSMGLNTQLTPIERHAVLYFIEQGLMPKTGKRYEWEVGVASNNPLAAIVQDFDWADEVLHAHIGRDWYVSAIGDARKAVEYGDECWSNVLMGWKQWKDDGLTEHRNWWPEIYAEACEKAGIEPDPEILAYHETYESKRADLQTIPAE